MVEMRAFGASILPPALMVTPLVFGSGLMTPKAALPTLTLPRAVRGEAGGVDSPDAWPSVMLTLAPASPEQVVLLMTAEQPYDTRSTVPVTLFVMRATANPGV